MTNTGQRAGKQVVQVYVSAPSVKLDKAYQDLCGFAKTKELASGESQEVAITFALSDFASYDEASASYILEAGNYIVRMGVSSQIRLRSLCFVCKKTLRLWWQRMSWEIRDLQTCVQRLARQKIFRQISVSSL